MSKPLAVFVFALERHVDSPRYGGFATRLQAAGGLKECEVLTVALENLVFIIDENSKACVIDRVSNVDIGTANFVYLKSWEGMPEEAGALANYLACKEVPFIDTLPMGMGVSKLATAFRLLRHHVTMPFTLYLRRSEFLEEAIKQYASATLSEKFIVKDIAGEKGKHNYLVSVQELRDVVAENPGLHFICQRYIPNSGDYRVGIYYNEPSFVIRRRGSGESHLNNTSAGGTAEYIQVKDVQRDLLALAKDAAEAAQLQVAGVDIIVDKETDRPFVLEVNQGSQIVTGAFVEQNIEAFNKALDRALHDERKYKAKMQIIGRRTRAQIPEFGIDNVVAKVDTGAHVSSLHAENIRLEAASDGNQELVFDIIPNNHTQTRNNKITTVRTKNFYLRPVRSSNGEEEIRYAVRTQIIMEGVAVDTVITLSDRSTMKYPMLAGRHAIRSRFFVDVELDEDGQVRGGD